MNFLKLLGVVTFMFLSRPVYGQASYPKIGKKMPAFTLEGVTGYREANISDKKLAGHPYLLDLFSLGCVSCFQSFQHINKFQDEFRGKIDFFLVGLDFGEIRKVYSDYEEAYSMNLPVAYSRTLFKNFRVHGVPHVIWVNAQGIVVAITQASSVTESNLGKFLSGKDFPFCDFSFDAQVRRSRGYNERKPLLVDNNGGKDTSFLFRSLIVKWKQEDSYGIQISFDDAIANGLDMPGKIGFQCLGVELGALYRLSLLGVESWLSNTKDSTLKSMRTKLVLLTKDSLKFKGDFDTGKNMYSYSLIIPKEQASSQLMQKILRNDLNSYFGYRANIELVKQPYWELAVDSSTLEKITTKGGESFFHGSFSRITFANLPISSFVDILNQKFAEDEGLIFYKLDGSHAIDLDAGLIMTDFSKTKNELDKLGIHLIKRDTFLKSIVIRD